MPPNNSPFNQTPQPGAPQATPQQQFPVPGQQPTPPQPIVGSAQTTQQQTTPEKPTPKNPNSSQSTLQLSEMRDGMVVMNDGSFRAVVACKSINFDLMSDREREGVEYSYQNFLNSLNFPVQILIRSQRVDIGPYIDKLINERRSQDNMLLGVLMDDYINFIDVLAQEANIMEKSFYIVVPYFPKGDAANFVEQGKGFFGKLFIFTVAIESGKLYLAIAGVIFSVISAYYYLKIIKTMYLDEGSEELNYNLDQKQFFVIILMAFLMLFFVIYADTLISFIDYIYFK